MGADGFTGLDGGLVSEIELGGLGGKDPGIGRMEVSLDDKGNPERNGKTGTVKFQRHCIITRRTPYLPGFRLIFCWIELLGLVCGMGYRALALAEFLRLVLVLGLGLGLRRRHLYCRKREDGGPSGELVGWPCSEGKGSC